MGKQNFAFCTSTRQADSPESPTVAVPDRTPGPDPTPTYEELSLFLTRFDFYVALQQKHSCITNVSSGFKWNICLDFIWKYAWRLSGNWKKKLLIFRKHKLATKWQTVHDIVCHFVPVPSLGKISEAAFTAHAYKKDFKKLSSFSCLIGNFIH